MNIFLEKFICKIRRCFDIMTDTFPVERRNTKNAHEMNMMLYLDGLWLCELCDAILISRIMIARNGWNEINEAVLRSE